ncbi:MAG: tetratricopeptide repeat protein [Candidatus Anammoxibacter sp.]
MNKNKSFKYSCCLVFLAFVCAVSFSGCFSVLKGTSNRKRIDSLEFKIDELGRQIESIGNHTKNIDANLAAMSSDKDRLNSGYLQLKKEINSIQTAQNKTDGKISKMKKAVISSQKAIKKIYNKILNVEDKQVEIREKIKETSDSRGTNTNRGGFEYTDDDSDTGSNKKIVLDNIGAMPDKKDVKHDNAVAQLLNKAKKLTDDGMIVEAIKLYEEILVALPDQLDVHYKLGRLYYGQGMVDKSIETYKRIIALNSEDAEAHSLLGVSYAKNAMIDEAIVELQKALKINPNLAEVHVGLSVAYLKKKMVKESISANMKAIEIDPDFAKAHKYLGIAYKRNGMPNKAKEEFALYKKLTK